MVKRLSNTNQNSTKLTNVPTPASADDAANKSYVDNGLSSHANNTSNPHNVTKSQVGLGNVDNTSDIAKPVSTAQAAADALKVDKDSLVFNVKDFGAVGDDSTDDTTAIQAALDAADAQGGGIVFFPAGAYKITDALTLGDGLNLKGVSSTASVIHQTSTSDHGIGATDLLFFSMSNIRVKGPSSGTGDGINFAITGHEATNYLNMSDVHIDHFGNDGIAVDNGIVSNLTSVTSALNGRYGFYLHGTTDGAAGTSTQLTSCYANENTSIGFYIYNMVYCALQSCASEKQPINYLVEDCQSVSLYSCGSERATGTGTSVDFKIDGGFGIGMYQCWSYENIGKAFWVTGTANAITLIGLIENTPVAGATACIQIDTGCNVTLSDISNTTVNSIAAGTTNILNDGGGNMVSDTAIFTPAFYTDYLATKNDTKVTIDANVQFNGSLTVPSYGSINSGGGKVLELGAYGAPVNNLGLQSSL